ncbi:MAG: hypothetical protein LBF28_01485, partial [Rickettsiales bacterium]|nr:hypothetical protein [Rickettsiales bacterium]
MKSILRIFFGILSICLLFLNKAHAKACSYTIVQCDKACPAGYSQVGCSSWVNSISGILCILTSDNDICGNSDGCDIGDASHAPSCSKCLDCESSGYSAHTTVGYQKATAK